MNLRKKTKGHQLKATKIFLMLLVAVSLVACDARKEKPESESNNNSQTSASDSASLQTNSDQGVVINWYKQQLKRLRADVAALSVDDGTQDPGTPKPEEEPTETEGPQAKPGDKPETPPAQAGGEKKKEPKKAEKIRALFLFQKRGEEPEDAPIEVPAGGDKADLPYKTPEQISCAAIESSEDIKTVGPDPEVNYLLSVSFNTDEHGRQTEAIPFSHNCNPRNPSHTGQTRSNHERVGDFSVMLKACVGDASKALYLGSDKCDVKLIPAG